MALFEVWKRWGIAPSLVMGHGVGEYAAARAAGVFDLEAGLKLVSGIAVTDGMTGLTENALPVIREAVAAVRFEMPRIEMVSSLTCENSFQMNMVVFAVHWASRRGLNPSHSHRVFPPVQKPSYNMPILF